MYPELATFLELTDLIEIQPRAPFSISQLNSKVNLMRSCIMTHCLVFWLVSVSLSGAQGHRVDHIGADVLCPNPRTLPPRLPRGKTKLYSPHGVSLSPPERKVKA